MGKRRIFRLSYLIVVLLTLGLLLLFNYFDTATTSSGYCLSCHEMNTAIGEGWHNSRHFTNDLGMVAECSDCHVNPGAVGFLMSKAWPAVRDHYVHLFGEADPARMDWEGLRARARMTINNEACKRCHDKLTDSLVSKAAMEAHAAAERAGEAEYPNCLTCHVEPMHPAMPAWNRDAGLTLMFSHVEVESHNLPDNFYVIVDDGVYDVTQFRKYHSGGGWCFAAGEDTTAACRTCHQGPEGTDHLTYLDSYGVPQDYDLLTYQMPKIRIGTLINTSNPAGQYFVEQISLMKISPGLDRFQLQDDLGITKRYVVGNRGAWRERGDR